MIVSALFLKFIIRREDFETELRNALTILRDAQWKYNDVNAQLIICNMQIRLYYIEQLVTKILSNSAIRDKSSLFATADGEIEK